MSWNLLYALDFIALISFLVSYYHNCYRRGYRVDYWHINLFLYCVMPNMIMLPLAHSELNRIVLGQDMDSVQEALPTVFLVTLVGYLSILAGGRLWQLQLGIGIRKAAVRVLDVVPRCSLMLMSSSSVLIFQSVLCLLLQLMILAIFFSRNGFGFDLRAFTFANPSLRPVALAISSYTILIASHCLARYVEKKEKVLLACTLLLTFGMIFFGARSNLVAIYIAVLTCYLVKLRDRISLLRISSLMASIVTGVLYLGSLRAGSYSPSDFFRSIAFLLFYGDTFSDLRDFAWVYSAWDHAFWAGKTYVAALMSFIPRFASEFRDTWGLGVATASTVGFDPQLHPGLRPGVFGEGFFNFGLFGVVAVGIMLGVVLKRVDTDIKQALAPPRPSMMKAFASSMMIGVASTFAISSGFSGLYILAGLYFFTWFCVSVHRIFMVRPFVGGDARSDYSN
jgi:oligosaccharide repeat unit polymerase